MLGHLKYDIGIQVLDQTRLLSLPREFFSRDPRAVAPELINLVLLNVDGRAGRIVEVEAYAGSEDPAAHSFRGKTRRNASMFGPAGHLYVYFTYGMHWCANVVCGEVGEGVGVLMRALEPLSGLDQMRASRPGILKDRELCRGPARLAKSMGITGTDDGADLMSRDSRFRLLRDPFAPAVELKASPRIGISKAVEAPWRWFVDGCRYVSGR